MKLYIQSFSSIITNSSSEVFTIFNDRGIKILKDSINTLLKAVGSDKTTDDLFEISLCVTDYFADRVLENLEDFGLDHEPCEQELLEMALDYDREYYNHSDLAVDIYLKPKLDGISGALWNLVCGCFESVELY